MQRLGTTLWNNANTHVQANFIYKQEIRYAFNYNAAIIEGIQVSIDHIVDNEKGQIVIRYQLSVDQFEQVSKPDGVEVSYREIYSVLDEDLREVAKNETVRQIGNIPDDDFKFEERINISLPEGKYTLYIRIEDQNAENLGIFKQEFEVKDL